MTTVVFVHGTGVRLESLKATGDLLAKGLALFCPSARLTLCSWGESTGARLGRGGVSIPAGLSERGIDDSVDSEIDLWASLEIDPLFELAHLAGEGPIGELPPGVTPPGMLLRRQLALIAQDETVRLALTDVGLAEMFFDTAEVVMASVPAQSALRSRSLTSICMPLARAFVAAAMREADHRICGTLPVDRDHREAVVDLISHQIDPSGIRGSIFEAAAASAKRLAVSTVINRKVDRERLLLTQTASPMAGDIMLYLTRGAEIRSFVAQTLDSIEDEVVVLAHSLGGIISFDALCERPHPKVKAIVTVGSQIPYLYELNALPMLAINDEDRLPGHFPPKWHNIYDRRDVLSFLASPIFGDHVTDWELDSRMTFPRSHSAYFSSKHFLGILAGIIDESQT